MPSQSELPPQRDRNRLGTGAQLFLLANLMGACTTGVVVLNPANGYIDYENAINWVVKENLNQQQKEVPRLPDSSFIYFKIGESPCAVGEGTNIVLARSATSDLPGNYCAVLPLEQAAQKFGTLYKIELNGNARSKVQLPVCQPNQSLNCFAQDGLMLGQNLVKSWGAGWTPQTPTRQNR